MVQIIDRQGSISGRLGKALGQGLAEQLPKEVERYRLSSGLQQLENSGQNLSPIQQYSALVKSGANPDQINQILPLLERSNANREAQTQANQINTTPVKNNAQRNAGNVPVNEPGQPGNQKTTKKPSLITTGPQQAALNPIRPLTADEIKTEGANLRAQYPNLYKTQAEGEAEAVARRNRDIAAQNAEIQLGATQKAIRNEIESEITKKVGQNLQTLSNGETYEKVPGTYLKKIVDQADSEVASGNKTTQEAAEDASNELRDYADLRLANKTEGQKWMLSKKPSDVRSMVKGQRNAYEKRGELKTFVNDLVTNHDVTKPRAQYIAYPIQNNKPLNNWLSKEKSKSFVDKLGDMFTDNKNETRARELARELPKYLGDDDSLGAIAVEIDGKGLDGTAFIDEVRRMKDEEKIRLNKRQEDELDTTGSLMPSLGDWFLFSLGDFGTLPEVL